MANMMDLVEFGDDLSDVEEEEDEKSSSSEEKQRSSEEEEEEEEDENIDEIRTVGEDDDERRLEVLRIFLSNIKKMPTYLTMTIMRRLKRRLKRWKSPRSVSGRSSQGRG